jgi:hypothetical protein
MNPEPLNPRTMKHLVFILHPHRVAYRMGGATGSHPCEPRERESVMAYLIGMIQPTSTEVINA